MDQVKKMIIACIISRKGGVPLTEIDNEYQQLVGTKIPFSNYGFRALKDFLQSIAEVLVVHNPDGSIILKAKDTKTSHIASLVEKQKTTANARKKATNCYRMPAAGQSFMRGGSSRWNYENNRGNNYRKMERAAPEQVSRRDYNIASHRKPEMVKLHTVCAESLFKHPTEKEMAHGIETQVEKYSLKSAHKENEFNHFKTKHPLKINNRDFQQRNSTEKMQTLRDYSNEEFNKSQIKANNQRRISVDDTILVTIVNNYYRSSPNKDRSRQRRSLLSDWRTAEEEEEDDEEVQQNQSCRCYRHHQGYSNEFSAVRQKCRMKPHRLGEAVDYYEELYVQKQWIQDRASDYAENERGYYAREDSDYTRYKRDVSRRKPGILIKVKNEYAIDRHI